MALASIALTGRLIFTATAAQPSASTGTEIARSANVVWRDALWADDGKPSHLIAKLWLWD
jgi:hypothetical protein